MNCKHCGHPSHPDAFFCNQCGTELYPLSLDTLTKRIKHLMKARDLEAAWLIHRVFFDYYYLQKYNNWEEYSLTEFNKSDKYMYRYHQVGEIFFEVNGNACISNINAWGIGQLMELVALCPSTIYELIESGTVRPSMTCLQIKDIARKYKRG